MTKFKAVDDADVKVKGIKQDYVEAAKWFRLAAEQGHAEAQNNLGDMYAKGEGVKKDHKKAVSWFKLSAEQDNADAQFKLAEAYENGRSVEQSYIEAYKWYYLADVNQNYVSLSGIIDRVKDKMTKAQLCKSKMNILKYRLRRKVRWLFPAGLAVKYAR